MDWTLELVMLPVSDVDRAKAFYTDKVGFNADHDHRVHENLRFVQLTPPGSACSIAVGEGITTAVPGSVQGLQIVVSDVQAAHDQLRARGVDVSEVQVLAWGSLVETEQGKRLAEALVKKLTGGTDPLNARYLHGEWFSYVPTFKLWIATNHKPPFRGTDNAIWNRIRLVPFTVAIPAYERDLDLPVRLRAELPGILAWAVRGCMDWQRSGLAEPAEVVQAVRSYRTEMDVMATWIADRCVDNANARTSSSALWEDWKRWCKSSGERESTRIAFGQRLAERSY